MPWSFIVWTCGVVLSIVLMGFFARRTSDKLRDVDTKLDEAADVAQKLHVDRWGRESTAITRIKTSNDSR